MTGKELKKKCETLGWYEDHIAGSHHIMYHHQKDYHIAIPIHVGKDLPKGTLYKIMKQAGLK